MGSKKFTGGRRSESPPLPFDVTQDIDPSLVEDLQPLEPTLTQTDFDAITLVLPEKPKRGA